MRVTKLIREYVEKRVYEAYPKSEVELRWEAKQNKMSDAITKANDIIEAEAKRVAEKLNVEYSFEGRYSLRAFEGRHWVTYDSWHDDEDMKLCREARETREKKIKETIEEILINLELGGTKADLDEMLAKVGK